MKKYDITILTESRYDNPEKNDWYIENLLLEDELVKKGLEKQGLKVARKDWNSNDFDWHNTKAVLFRTTWDYSDKYDTFKKWINKTRKICKFINSVEIINWNLSKYYLSDLQKKGVNIPPTIFINKNNKITLKEVFNQGQFKKAILKPVVSGGARQTYKIDKEEIQNYENIFKVLVNQEDMMLQEFQHRIVSEGEMSLMIIGGKYTHAVIKKAKKGDFRVQDDFGGSVHKHKANKKEIEFAEKAMAASNDLPAYGRADIFYDNNNELAIGELELIEPELWFRNNYEAAYMLGEVIKNSYL